MAIHPIDLQTLFTQMDKVGKDQSLQREGLQIQASLQQLESQKKAEELVRSVNETQDSGDGAERIKDQAPRREQSGREGERRESDEAEEEPAKKDGLIRDPSLGRNIDISG